MKLKVKVASEVVDNGVSQAAVVNKYNLSAACVSRWVKSLPTLKLKLTNKKHKRLRIRGSGRQPAWPELEKQLVREISDHRHAAPSPHRLSRCNYRHRRLRARAARARGPTGGRADR